MRLSLPKVRPPTGDEFHRAVSQYSAAWYSACLRITRDPLLAQDAVQDALLSGWHKRNQFKGQSSLETWLHRIAVNAALSLVRRRRDHLEWSEESDPRVASRHAINEDDLHDSVVDSLEHLSELERVCFVLKHLEEWRLAEIAKKLDVNEGSVKQALFRAVGKLRQSMGYLREQDD